MRRLIRILLGPRGAPLTAVVLLLVFGGLAAFSTQVVHDDDLLAFLPAGHDDVVAFKEINKRFGGLEVAVVGYAVDDALAPKELARLRELTEALDRRPEVGYALSLANVEDVAPDPAGGIQTRLLVPPELLPREELVARLNSRPLINGELVSRDLKAYALYAFAPPGADPRAFAHVVQEVAESKVPADELRLYGAPFISSYIYETTQEDLRQLTPWAVALVVLLVIIAFRDLWGALLALLAPALGAAGALGAMALAGVPSNLVLSSMPVILFSVGSAYGIHVLANYYRHAATETPTVAMERTLVEVGPTVIAAGLTTVAGLLSFMVMDMLPLRTFGLFTGLGLLFSLFLSLTFVPAVACTLKLKSKPRGPSPIARATAALVASVESRPLTTRAALLAALVLGLVLAGRVDARMDPKSFFAEGSPPAAGESFFAEHFGGATYVQVELATDLREPVNLHMLSELSDRIHAVSGVVSVRHVAEVVSEVNQALQGSKRIPDTSDQVQAAFGFLAGQRSVEQLVTTDRQHAVLMVKLGPLSLDDLDTAVQHIESRVAEVSGGHWVVKSGDAARAARVRRALAAFEAGGQSTTAAEREAVRVVAESKPKIASHTLVAPLEKFLASDESLVDLSSHPELRAQIARRAAESPDDLEAALLPLIPADGIEGDAPAMVAEDLAMSLETPISEFRRAAATEALSVELQKGLRSGLAARTTKAAYALQAPALLELGSAAEPASAISARVSGLPVLHRALSESARSNQLASLGVALALVLLVLTLKFGSLRIGLMASAPTVLTLAVVYGGMGALGIHLDLGTSMLASLIIGAGVDYAVHLVSAERASAATDQTLDATYKTAPAVWTNALVVAAGFALLTVGEARPLQNVAGLTAVAMLAAALGTFVTVAAWPRPKRRAQPVAALSEERP